MHGNYFIISNLIIVQHTTVEPLYNGYHWGIRFWPLKRGGHNRGVLCFCALYALG